MTVIPLNTETKEIISGISGVLVKYDVEFAQELQWKVKDQVYKIRTDIRKEGESYWYRFESYNSNGSSFEPSRWEGLRDAYGGREVDALKKEFEKYDSCPREDQLGYVWLPFFGEDISELWRLCWDRQHCGSVKFCFSEKEFPDREMLGFAGGSTKIVCAYQGVVADSLAEDCFPCYGALLLSGSSRPGTDISRSGNIKFPLEVLVAVYGICAKYEIRQFEWTNAERIGYLQDFSLKDWRRIRMSRADYWLHEFQKDLFVSRKQELQNPSERLWAEQFFVDVSYKKKREFLSYYLTAYFQDNYKMKINYKNGQSISFSLKAESGENDIAASFPPMLFCMAADDENRKYVCSEKCKIRRGITADHPFVVWLLENGAALNQHYPRQFGQIAECFCEKDAQDMIKTCNAIREQLLSLPVRHGVDASSMPQLKAEDFWRC